MIPAAIEEVTIFKSALTFFVRRKSTESEPSVGIEKDVQGWKARGNELLAAGKIVEATECYRCAVQAAPGDPSAHINLGYGLLELGAVKDAQENLERALELDGSLVDAHFLLGQAYVRSGALQAAARSFKSALALKPGFDFAWFELARLQDRMQELEAALSSYSQVLTINPAFIDAAAGKASILLGMERWGEALKFVAAQSRVNNADIFVIQQACALNGLERYAEALPLVNRVLSHNPDELEALNGKAAVLAGLGQYAQAFEIHQKVLQQKPKFLPALYNAALMCEKLGRLQEALDLYIQAVEVEPTDAATLCSMAHTLLQLGRVRDALDVCNRGLAIHPKHANLRWNKAISHLLLGELRQGWVEYEWRWFAKLPGHSAARMNLSRPMWRGEPISGKTIFLVAEQGLGDTLQMLRYIPLLIEKGARVLLQAPASLSPLCEEMRRHCTLVNAAPAEKDYDYHCPMLSLPLAFRTELPSIPAGLPYLRSDSQLRQQWGKMLGPRRGPRIGLVWSGSTTHQNDHNRSIPLSVLLAALPAHCELISLQKEARESDKPALEKSRIFHAGEALRTFADTAALTDLMDIVISVDTSVAHLAGAMGKPLWIMLPYFPDWRWLLEREDSPWYPSAKLFRQAEDRDWRPVLGRIAGELGQAFPPG